jgi:hypothetical protein
MFESICQARLSGLKAWESCSSVSRDARRCDKGACLALEYTFSIAVSATPSKLLPVDASNPRLSWVDVSRVLWFALLLSVFSAPSGLAPIQRRTHPHVRRMRYVYVRPTSRTPQRSRNAFGQTAAV